MFTVESTRLTLPRYVNAVKARGDTLYMLGGHNESVGRGVTAVEYATVGVDGAARWAPCATASLRSAKAISSVRWADSMARDIPIRSS